jgi:hypothetical protein
MEMTGCLVQEEHSLVAILWSPVGQGSRSDNAICLNAGIFDSFSEPDIALWYRRYVRFAGLDGTGLVPYVGVGTAVLANIHVLSETIVMSAATTGVDWNFWSMLSLCGEANLLLSVRPWPPRPVFMPALSLRAGF